MHSLIYPFSFPPSLPEVGARGGAAPPPFPGVLRGSRSGDPAGELPPQRGLSPSLRSPWGARPSFSAARRGRESATGSGEDNVPGSRPPGSRPPGPGGSHDAPRLAAPVLAVPRGGSRLHPAPAGPAP